MPEDHPGPEPGLPSSNRRFIARVAAREARLVRRKKEGPRNFLRSAALVGVIGWTVVLPMLIGIAIGRWLDHKWPGRASWTITLLIVGLVLGCAGAWSRIRREQEDR